MKLVRSVLIAWAVFAVSSIAFAAEPALSAEGRAVRWHVTLVPSQAKPGDDVEVVFVADIPSGWIVYSSDFSLEIGPLPAKFIFDANPSIELVGPIAPIGPQRKTDPKIGTYSFFVTHAEFRQKARVLAPLTPVSGRISGQKCFEESGLCELFRETFSASP
ncbi:MAG TPA: hypothetical protein VMS40_04910 [Vicinamibacterales bacterium]|nr:hypothetical protein [Vicinamibacterales bacterium]